MASSFCQLALRRCLQTRIPQLRRGLTTAAAAPSSPPSPSSPATPASGFMIASTAPPQEAKDEDFFGLNNLYSLEDMMESRVHFGHKEQMLNGHMRPFIFGRRLGVLIFDLEQTDKLLKQALHVSAEIAYRNGIILFIHQSRQNAHLVEAAARDCGEYAYCRRWRNEVLTDSHKTFGAVTRLPDLIIFFSTLERANDQHPAIISSAKMLIPTVGICDTNSDPTLITYPIPGNDDSPQSIEFYCRLFKTAIMNGKARRKEIIEKQGEDYYYHTLKVAES